MCISYNSAYMLRSLLNKRGVLSVYIFVVMNIRQFNDENQDLWSSSIPVRGVLGLNRSGPECLFLLTVNTVRLFACHVTKYSLLVSFTREAETVLGPNSRRFPFSIITFLQRTSCGTSIRESFQSVQQTLYWLRLAVCSIITIYRHAEIALWIPFWPVLGLWKATDNAAKHWLRIIVFSFVFRFGL